MSALLLALHLDPATLLVLLPGLIALGHAIAVSVRDALTAQVPPVWARIRSPYRGILAAIAGAVVVLLSALGIGSSWTVAVLAMLANLVTTIPRLIYAERTGPGDPPEPPPSGAPAT